MTLKHIADLGCVVGSIPNIICGPKVVKSNFYRKFHNSYLFLLCYGGPKLSSDY